MPQRPVSGFPEPDSQDAGLDPQDPNSPAYDQETQRAIDDIIRQQYQGPDQGTPGEPGQMDSSLYGTSPVAPEPPPPEVVYAEDLQWPEVPAPPSYHDTSHPNHNTKLSALLRILHSAAQGAAAGYGQKSFGAGFMAAQAAEAQRQQMQQHKQAAQDISQQRQAATTMQQQRIQSYPLDRAIAQQRQQALTDATIARMKRVPSDKHLGGYVSADGKQTLIFQAGDGSTYEKSFGQVQQREQPVREPRAPSTVIMGRYRYQWDHDTDKWTRIGPAPEHQGYDANGQRRTPQTTFAKIEKWKADSLGKIQRNSQLIGTDNKVVDPEALLNAKQMIQDQYEQMIQAAGGDVEHYDYSQQGDQAAPVNRSKHDPLGIR